MYYLTFDNRFNNSKLFFSKKELTKILSCYSTGVSQGKWKDYAINFQANEANFFMFKHASSFPDCILTKTKKEKRNKIILKLKMKNITKNYTNNIDDLITFLKRKNLKLI